MSISLLGHLAMDRAVRFVEYGVVLVEHEAELAAELELAVELAVHFVREAALVAPFGYGLRLDLRKLLAAIQMVFVRATLALLDPCMRIS